MINQIRTMRQGQQAAAPGTASAPNAAPPAEDDLPEARLLSEDEAVTRGLAASVRGLPAGAAAGAAPNFGFESYYDSTGDAVAAAMDTSSPHSQHSQDGRSQRSGSAEPAFNPYAQ